VAHSVIRRLRFVRAIERIDCPQQQQMRGEMPCAAAFDELAEPKSQIKIMIEPWRAN